MPVNPEELAFLVDSPVELTDTGSDHPEVEEGMAFCLSGGGYRAMLFHLGALWRLNELGYLRRLTRVSSVSGGSIIAGVLGLNWMALGFDKIGVGRNFDKAVVEPVRRLACRTIDAGAFFRGLFWPGSINSMVIDYYRKLLFGDSTLQELPDDPRFVIVAANVQSNALWRFMKPYMRDWRVGEVKNPQVPLAFAVAASSAFPPVLSPAVLKLDPAVFSKGSGSDLQADAFRRKVVLTDGGVIDNLGLETAWKRYDTIFVSDAGEVIGPQEKPKRGWAGHTLQAVYMIHGQVQSLRKRQLIGSFIKRERKGAYWGIGSDIRNYGLDKTLECPLEKTARLAKVPIRLRRIAPVLQERLINWGYAACDTAVRRHFNGSHPEPPHFPYPQAGVG
ncbi:MAG: patatin-like phospholipase family protein [Candidatus Glassbacteria bacterium]|nr:patatin-like phospholipase family protein [Candidatus Glassbacteria bacterium]